MSKRIVLPGDLVTDQPKRAGDHVFMREGKIYSTVLGVVDDTAPMASVVPLEGRYMPRESDVIIGIVQREEFSGFRVDINSIYQSFISKKDFRYSLKPGDVISARVEYVNEVNEADLADIRVLEGGEVILMSPVKVPRLIGKNSSMLDIVKRGTHASMMVAGRNGRIWVKDGDMALVKEALDKIETQAHKSNLTNSMADFFKLSPPPIAPTLAPVNLPGSPAFKQSRKF